MTLQIRLRYICVLILLVLIPCWLSRISRERILQLHLPILPRPGKLRRRLHLQLRLKIWPHFLHILTMSYNGLLPGSNLKRSSHSLENIRFVIIILRISVSTVFKRKIAWVEEFSDWCLRLSLGVCWKSGRKARGLIILPKKWKLDAILHLFILDPVKFLLLLSASTSY